MTFRPLLLTALLLGTGLAQAQTDSFTLPADLTSSPFNCKLNGSAYDCPAISLGKDTTLTLTGAVSLNVSGGFDASKTLTTVNNGNKFTMTVSGAVDFRKDLTANIDLTVAGPLNFAKDAHFTGNITTAGDFTVAKDSWIVGNVIVSGDLDMGKNSYINGTCIVTGHTDYAGCSGGSQPPKAVHHVRLDHDGAGLTCAPESITVTACSAADTGSTCPTTTVGVSGNVVAAYNGGAISVPFTISPNTTSTTVSLGVTVAGNATLSTTGPDYTCRNNAAGNTSCVIDFEDSGFIFKIPDHYSDTKQALSIAAVTKGTNPKVCAPTFQNVAKSITFTCTFDSTHADAGGLLPTVDGAALNCGKSGASIMLNFDNTGKSTNDIKFNYEDAGRITITASSGAVTGSSTFVAAPSRFVVTASKPEKGYVAGLSFPLLVTALNAGGKKTISYDQGNAATLDWMVCQPATGKPSKGTLGDMALSFKDADGKPAGAASLKPYWSEAGKIDFFVEDLNYLDTKPALPIRGTTNSSGKSCDSGDGAVGPFIPHHFTTAIKRADGTTDNPRFIYSGQPIPVTITALNAQEKTTFNYYGSVAKEVTLSAVDPVNDSGIDTNIGALSNAKVPATAFTSDNGGVAVAAPAFTFKNKLAPPLTIAIKANDPDDVSSKGWLQRQTEIRSGRLRLTNVFGGAKQDAKMPVRAEYWTGQSWLPNSEDTGAAATKIPVEAIALSPAGFSSVMNTSTITLNAGQGLIMLKQPAAPGFVDLAVNLGATTQDASCLSSHPVTTGSKQDWLRSQYGNCGNNADPSARASFGIYAPGTKRAIHIRERFN